MCVLVPPLGLPRHEDGLDAAAGAPAVELFTSRPAGPSRLPPGEENVAAVIELCARLEGMPLAIELAAARLRFMSLAELVARLVVQLDVLSGGPRRRRRHRSLRDTIDWSIRLLDDTERVVLRHLAVFSGGADLESVEAVCALNP